MIKFYNTLTKQKQDFVPQKGKTVRMYTCGPTVYDYAHIGNLRSFIFADILRRTLEFGGYKVNAVMNITDVGHLVSDADSGEDKLEVAKKREGKNAWEIAEFYTNAFFKDTTRLNIKKPNKIPRATKHIKEQIALICELEKKGYTYQISDGIYFDTARFSNYGALAGQKLEEKEAGARVEINNEKKNPWDFALWKFSPKGKKRDMEWKSPWGVGFPGWHIECSAMSRKYLGQPFDIHTGGIDHIAVHHTNEIAQSEAAYGVLLAKFWMHGDFLTVDNGRMGKSKGNLITIDQLAEKGFSPLAYRYFVLGAHYRSKLNFTWESIGAAQNALNNLYNTVRTWKKSGGVDKNYKQRFEKALNDDLNIALALAVVWDLVKSDARGKAATLLEFDKVLGLDLKKYIGKKIKIPEKIKKLAAEREKARKEKDFKKADALRKEIEKNGFLVEDMASGPSIRKK